MKLQLINSEGKELQQDVPNLKLGEKIEKIKISQKNEEWIEFILEELRKEGVTEKTVKDKYRSPLIILAYVLNMDIINAKRDDMKLLNSWIITTDRYQYYRKENFRIAIRKAFRIWKGTGDENPPEVYDMIRPKNERKPKPKKPRFLLKKDNEVDPIVNECKNNRDKFYIALRWNSGGRNVEIEHVKWYQIYEEDGLVKIDLDTAKKSGDEGDRVITLIYALPYYYRWKQEYKERFKIENDSGLKNLYVFRKLDEGIRGRKSKKVGLNKVPEKNEFLTDGYYLKLFKQIGENLKIPDFTPKLFRKYTISMWEREGIPHALIKKMSGHSKNSRAIEHYSFHDEEDCTKHLLRIAGMNKPEEKTIAKAIVITCKRCNKPNSSNKENCEFCGFSLNQVAMINQETLFKSQIYLLRQQIEEKTKIENERWEKLLTLLQNNPKETKTLIKNNKELVKELISK